MKKLLAIGSTGVLLCASGMANAITMNDIGFAAGTTTAWAPNLFAESSTGAGDGGTATVFNSHTRVDGGSPNPILEAVSGSGNFAIIGSASWPDTVKNGTAEYPEYNVLSQTFTLEAGESLSGWMLFDYGDDLAVDPDGAEVRVKDASGQLLNSDGTVSVSGDALLAQNGNTSGRGAWTDWSFTPSLAAATQFTIEFAAFNSRTYPGTGGAEDEYDHSFTSFGLFDFVVNDANTGGTGGTGGTSQVPEPSTVVLLGLGLAGLGYGRRRVKR